MSEKTIESVTANIKSIQLELSNLNTKRHAFAAKIEQLTTELEQYRYRRDQLELKKSQAPELLVNGSMSDEEFDSNKQELANLYQKIDDTAERIDIYQKMIDQELTKKSAEMNQKLFTHKNILLKLYSNKLVTEIIGDQADKFKQLSAILEHCNGSPLGYNTPHLLGVAIAGVIFGERNGHIVQQPTAEREALVKDTLTAALGV